MLPPYFIYISALISFVGGASYLLHTLQGKTRPHRVTYFMWSVAALIAFAAQVEEGVGLVALTTFMAGFMPLLIFTASFVNKKAVWESTRFDYVCGIFSLVGLFLWWITGEGAIAILFSILADGLAGVPTVIKSYTHPDSESWFGYFMFGTAAAVTLLTIDNWTFENYGFALYVLALNMVFVLLIRFKFGLKLKTRLGN